MGEGGGEGRERGYMGTHHTQEPTHKMRGDAPIEYMRCDMHSDSETTHSRHFLNNANISNSSQRRANQGCQDSAGRRRRVLSLHCRLRTQEHGTCWLSKEAEFRALQYTKSERSHSRKKHVRAWRGEDKSIEAHGPRGVPLFFCDMRHTPPGNGRLN